jgi:hypothetical protein
MSKAVLTLLLNCCFLGVAWTAGGAAGGGLPPGYRMLLVSRGNLEGDCDGPCNIDGKACSLDTAAASCFTFNPDFGCIRLTVGCCSTCSRA